MIFKKEGRIFPFPFYNIKKVVFTCKYLKIIIRKYSLVVKGLKGIGNGEWTKEIVLEMILNLHQKRVRLQADRIEKAYTSLYFHAVKYYGSWENAISHLGIAKTKYISGKREPDYVF